MADALALGGDELFDLLIQSAETHHEAASGFNAASINVCDNLSALRNGHRDRLFHKNVFARASGFDSLFGMKNNGSCDIYRFNLGICDEVICVCVGVFGVIFFFKSLDDVFVNVHNRYEFGVFGKHHTGHRSSVGYTAGADNAPFNFSVHKMFLLSAGKTKKQPSNLSRILRKDAEKGSKTVLRFPTKNPYRGTAKAYPSIYFPMRSDYF